MDHMGSPPLHPADHASSTTKRKRSPSNDPPSQPTPPTKVPKTLSHHLQINYLVRQFPEILPLISAEHGTLPSLLSLIGDYEGVLQRHESMAGNLGARPLGPILIQRFERLFDGPPRVLKINGKESTSVGWLDVVEFARNKPEQFKLEQTREGVKVCQFYTKQCRVEISEEDFVLIRSGMPQKLIPPQPIGEDEEKELGTLEILEKALGGCVHLADQGRARQLNHKLRSRKNAIISRREAEAAPPDERVRSPAPSRNLEKGHSRNQSNGDRASNSPTGGGFVAVNRYSGPSDRLQYNGTTYEHPRSSAPATNGITPLHGVSAATRAELLSKFHTTSERSNSIPENDSIHRYNTLSRSTAPSTKPNSRPYADSMEYAGVLLNTASPVPIPNTPSSLLPYVKPSPADRFDDSGPYKADMMARMEQLNRGDRVQPPCDRCRRLHMDCLKNLTACMGCTKKHAKCSWKDVEEQELKDHPFVLRVRTAEEMAAAEAGSDGEGGGSARGSISASGSGSRSGGEAARQERTREMMEVRDEELLGEDSGDEDPSAVKQQEGVNLESAKSPITTDINISNSQQREQMLATISPLPPDTFSGLISSNITPRTIQVNPSNNVSNHATSGDASAPKEPSPVPYQAPKAQMQTFPADKGNGTPRMDGRVQTEYERDIYSQLSEATRGGAEHEHIANDSSHAEPVRVYTAGSEPLKPSTSPIPPMRLDSVQDPPPEQQLESETGRTVPQKGSNSPVQDHSHTPMPQMPSPPLSGVPTQTTPSSNTPMPEQPLSAQMMQV